MQFTNFHCFTQILRYKNINTSTGGFRRFSVGFSAVYSHCIPVTSFYYQYVVVPVVPVVGGVGAVVPDVDGLNGNPAQYLTIDCEIRRRVSGLRTLPVFACAILSFCDCDISLRYVRFITVVVFIMLIIRIVLIINIVHFGKINFWRKINTPNRRRCVVLWHTLNVYSRCSGNSS